jgi:hypothetical protein
MSNQCDADVFKRGHAIALLDACMHRAELFRLAVAQESGQSVDWHYSGGRANMLYLGDFARVDAAVSKLAPMLETTLPREEGECSSCAGKPHHRAATILQRYAPEACGTYRDGDDLPLDVISVES